MSTMNWKFVTLFFIVILITAEYGLAKPLDQSADSQLSSNDLEQLIRDVKLLDVLSRMSKGLSRKNRFWNDYCVWCDASSKIKPDKKDSSEEEEYVNIDWGR